MISIKKQAKAEYHTPNLHDYGNIRKITQTGGRNGANEVAPGRGKTQA